MRNRRPERYADEGRVRTYRVTSSRTHQAMPEDHIRLMGILHSSRQPSHMLFTTTEEGFVEQHLTTDMALPFMGETVSLEDITPAPVPE